MNIHITPRQLMDQIKRHEAHKLSCYVMYDSNDHQIGWIIECNECYEILVDVTSNTSSVGVDPRSVLS